MSSNLLGISVTGLRVAQSSLNTTGHNIANANVEGYSRQRVNAETNPASLQNGGYVGNGTRVQSIERIANDFINSQLRLDTTLFNDLDSYYDNISSIDTLLSDISTGLSSGLESFYASVQNGADDPTSIPARQLIISETENLSDRFNTIYNRLEAQENNINAKLESAVSQINALTSNIAELNQKVANSLGTGAVPNDLIDKREEAIKELSKIVSLQAIEQGFGQVNIVIGSGQNLVIGSDVRNLSLAQSNQDANKYDVVFEGGGAASYGQVITDLVSGGELGGLLRFRDTVMEKVYNEFGRVAVVMADTFNTTHSQGVNLNNEFGGNFFYDVNDEIIADNRVIGNSNNAQPNDRTLSLTIENSSDLIASNYSVSVRSGGLFTITRDTDDVEVFRGALNGSYPFTAAFDGLELEFTRGSFQAGDQFKLQPFKSGGRDFSSGLINPEDIAFGSPLLTESALGNLGSGAISSGEVISLLDQNGLELPLLSTPGEMNPPLLVNFVTPTTYEILDNSDPGNPVDLDPPIRNQQFVVGGTNELFNLDPGATMVSTEGDMIGIPEGRRAVSNASIQMTAPTAVPPDFTVSNFSGVADQFSFDVVISNTVGGSNNATVPVTISGGGIIDENTLLIEINSQLSTSNARAYIADNGTLAFRLATPGYGDLSLQNYAGGVAGQANNLLGFNIEGSTFTSVGDVNGYSGDGLNTNGYPAEAITITRPSDLAGGTPTTYNLFTSLNGSARETASLLNNIDGVQANAFNYVELSNANFSRSEPLQIQLNGESLIEYGVDSITGDAVLSATVPDPQADLAGFYDYIAERINENTNLSNSGIHAVAGANSISGADEIRIYDTQGNDLAIALTALVGETMDVSDGENPNLQLTGIGGQTTSSITVGGRMDVTLEDTLTLSTFPPNSMLFGDTSATNFAQSTYYGIQAEINGIPDQGDRFSLDFNNDAAMDNRNALLMSSLEKARIINGGVSSIGESYSALVEDVGIDTASTKINLDASEQVLAQSVERRNSISGVNLDEEAANLIKFEQMFSANAQVISVARDLFDRLISAF